MDQQYQWFYTDYGPYSFNTAVQIRNDWAAQGLTVEVVGSNVAGSYFVRYWYWA